MKKVFAIVVALTCYYTSKGQVKILFDANHAESAANADWVIDADLHNMGWGATGGYTCTCSSNESNAQRLPTPTQTAITSTTTETYWDGAISNWGIDCVKKGYWVETLPFGVPVLYGTANVQDLSNYDVYVVVEPNVLFTAAEKTALMNFVKNGGSLLMISDHTGSDRNGDGYDSPVIWNDFMSNNGVSNNSTGFSFSLQNFSGTFTNIVNAPTDTLLHGPFGAVTKVQWSGGTCMKINSSQNASVKPLIYKNGVGQADSAVLVLTTRVGCGKIAAMGDSSPADDGTGDPNDNSLYNGYIVDASGNHQKLLMNMMVWLAQHDCNTGVHETNNAYTVTLYPNPSSGEFTIESVPGSIIRIFDLTGKELYASVKNQSGSYKIKANLLPGVYSCSVEHEGKVSVKKLIIAP